MCRNTFKLILIQINNEEYILLINPFILDNQGVLAIAITPNYPIALRCNIKENNFEILTLIWLESTGPGMAVPI